MTKAFASTLLALGALTLAACGGSTDSPPATSSSAASSTTPAAPSESTFVSHTLTTAPQTPTTETTTSTTEVVPELDFDLEGDPCEGVSNVDVDGKHYECVDGVFRQQ